MKFNYPILLPPVSIGDQVFEDSVSLTEEAAAPLLALGVIGEATGEAEESELSEEQPVDDSDIEVEVTTTEDEDEKVNLNTATAEELTNLDYVGEAIANKIINGRPYDTSEAARLAGGITREKWNKIEPFLTL